MNFDIKCYAGLASALDCLLLLGKIGWRQFLKRCDEIKEERATPKITFG